MNNNIQSILGAIVNPNTGKTLQEESRIVEIKAEQNELVFKYKRDGISVEQKQQLAEKVRASVSSFYKPEQVSILTTSETADTQKSAQITTGHGPGAGAAKKRVPNVKKVIAVSSCKGGVGKSTVAVNLAFALKNMGKKVGILDADIYGPSVPMLLNQREAKPIASLEKKILPINAYGISFMSFGLFVDEKEPVIWRGPMLGGVLNQFLFDVDWGELDYLIIDLPPGTGDMQLSMVQATDIDGAIVVSTPQDVALLDSKKGLKMFHQVKVPVLGMVENMSYFVPDDNPSKKYFIFGESGVKKAALELETPLLAEIPMEIALREASDNGMPYMNEPKYEGRPVWTAYTELAKNIDRSLAKGFFRRIFS
jgi:ATP-binding protein involved in chromosome partitioning